MAPTTPPSINPSLRILRINSADGGATGTVAVATSAGKKQGRKAPGSLKTPKVSNTLGAKTPRAPPSLTAGCASRSLQAGPQAPTRRRKTRRIHPSTASTGRRHSPPSRGRTALTMRATPRPKSSSRMTRTTMTRAVGGPAARNGPPKGVAAPMTRPTRPMTGADQPRRPPRAGAASQRTPLSAGMASPCTPSAGTASLCTLSSACKALPPRLQAAPAETTPLLQAKTILQARRRTTSANRKQTCGQGTICPR
jgi:hypothetical protein